LEKLEGIKEGRVKENRLKYYFEKMQKSTLLELTCAEKERAAFLKLKDN